MKFTARLEGLRALEFAKSSSVLRLNLVYTYWIYIYIYTYKTSLKADKEVGGCFFF